MFEDHIMVVDDALPKEQCEKLIDYYKWANENNLSFTRKQQDDGTDYTKQDTTVFPIQPETMEIQPFSPWLNPLLDSFWKQYQIYLDEYNALRDAGKEWIRSLRIQKTEPGEGYHAWHYESAGAMHSMRATAWMFYLNDVEEGGETEFLYQHKRIEPKQGRLAIWPATYTHVHRGNPPLKGTKYIITSWCEWY